MGLRDADTVAARASIAVISALFLTIAPAAGAATSWELTPTEHPSFAEDVLQMQQDYSGTETITLAAGECQQWAAEQAADLDLSFDKDGWHGTFLAEDGTANTAEVYDSNLSTGVPSATDAWPTFGLDAQRTSAPGSAPGGDGSLIWSFSTPASVAYTSPAVVDGTVYVGDDDGNVYAIDAETGTEDWSRSLFGPVYSSPAVVDGVVYIGDGDKNLHALDAADGSTLWTFSASDTIDSSPAVVDGTVYFGSWDDHVYAVDTSTGNQEWSFSADNDIRRSSPAVVDGTVYIGSMDGNVYAIDAATGNEQWSTATPENGGVRHSSPAVLDGTVYIGTYDGFLLALDADDGSVQWKKDLVSRLDASPAVTDDTLTVNAETLEGGVFMSNGNSREMKLLDKDTGDVKWSYKTDAGGTIESTAAYAQGTVYFGSHDDFVHALDAQTGSQDWETDTGNDVSSSPAVVGGIAYVGSHDNKVLALNAGGAQAFDALHTGATSWTDDATIDEGTYASDSVTGTFAIGEDEHLVFEMCNPGPKDTVIDTSGETLHSPDGSPGYPTSELSALALTVVGLVGVLMVARIRS